MITNRSRLMGSMIHYFTLIAPKSQVYKSVNCTNKVFHLVACSSLSSFPISTAFVVAQLGRAGGRRCP